MIYTSYYARHGNDNPKTIAISCTVPKWYVGEWMPILGPTWELIDELLVGSIDEPQYARKYVELLQQRKVSPESLVNGVLIPDGSILLCYERVGEFCHRRVLAEWVQYHTGVIIEEWKTNEELKEHNRIKTVESLIEF